jgi:hypothetical protein
MSWERSISRRTAGRQSSYGRENRAAPRRGSGSWGLPTATTGPMALSDSASGSARVWMPTSAFWIPPGSASTFAAVTSMAKLRR